MSSNLPPLRPPPRPHSPSGHRSQSSLSQSSVRSDESGLSTTSTESGSMPPPPVLKRPPYPQHPDGARPNTAGGGPLPSQSTSSIHSVPRQPYRSSVDVPSRTQSPKMPGAPLGHRARQHSQGFFEPSLPHASQSVLSASQIAAQAAMHSSPPAPPAANERKRSYPGLAPINTTGHTQRQPSTDKTPQVSSGGPLPYSNGTLGGNRLAAASAANAAFPSGRSPLPSPNSLGPQTMQPPPPVPPLDRHESFVNIFGRLSLDSINAATSPDPGAQGGRRHARSDPATTGAERPETAGSLSPNLSSFNSQGSTVLEAASSSSNGAMSLAGRSRATSNTSAGSFGTSLPHVNSPPGAPSPGPFPSASLSPVPAIADPSKVTETVARMLQCLYVLSSCQTGDVGQGVIDQLTGALKYNWLGRGRTGRDRRGFVGMKNPPGQRVGLVGA
ncbi:hypothetical protein D0868_00421 [Hortaea werneckii]|uniref:Uncharacterized protein n=1 Tax=Hortaea werneckii TaxID=91943 RepID=A0A3M6ZMA6_HORWE|nr:hypothetical protein D0868_00421 [Hortaea werneckii]